MQNICTFLIYMQMINDCCPEPNAQNDCLENTGASECSDDEQNTTKHDFDSATLTNIVKKTPDLMKALKELKFLVDEVPVDENFLEGLSQLDAKFTEYESRKISMERVVQAHAFDDLLRELSQRVYSYLLDVFLANNIQVITKRGSPDVEQYINQVDAYNVLIREANSEGSVSEVKEEAGYDADPLIIPGENANWQTRDGKMYKINDMVRVMGDINTLLADIRRWRSTSAEDISTAEKAAKNAVKTTRDQTIVFNAFKITMSKISAFADLFFRQITNTNS